MGPTTRSAGSGSRRLLPGSETRIGGLPRPALPRQAAALPRPDSTRGDGSARLDDPPSSSQRGDCSCRRSPARCRTPSSAAWRQAMSGRRTAHTGGRARGMRGAEDRSARPPSRALRPLRSDRPRSCPPSRQAGTTTRQEQRAAGERSKGAAVAAASTPPDPELVERRLGRGRREALERRAAGRRQGIGRRHPRRS
jgi:hypothetical protein